jgi:hypothetical protein
MHSAVAAITVASALTCRASLMSKFEWAIEAGT